MEARLLRAGGRVAEALELLAPLADEEAPGPELYRELAGCYLATRQPGPALQNARRYLEALPGSDTATLLMGEAMLASADLEGARRYLQDLAARPGSPARVRRMLVRALAGLGEHDRVIELAEPLRDACRDEGSFCEELGVAYHARGQWALAGEWLGRAARLVEPGRALLLRLAETEFEAGNARASLEHATALSERFPEDAPAQRLRGLALLALDRGAEAVPYLRFAVTRLPEEPRVRSGLAVALARVRDDSEVLALYPDNTSLETATAEAVLAVASVLERAGRRKQAMDLLEVRAQAGRLSSAGISLFAGQCLRDGDVVRAEGLLNTALGAAPKDVELLASRAELMIHRGRPRAAQQDLHRALELAPERPGTLKLLGELELELENSKEAAALLSRYVRLVPADANGQLALGRAWLAQGQPEKAEKALRTAVELNGQDAPAVGELLLALLGSARQAEAATLLREFTAGRPERLHSLCERAASTARSDQQEPARWLWRELALAGAPVESALLPLVAGLLADGADRDAWNVILEAGTRAPGALPVLAAKLLSGNRPEIAREVYRRSFELNGRNVSDLKGVARCHLELGERDRAISLLGEVRSRCPGDVESGYLLAKLQAEAGDRAAAREALAQVLGREPDHLPALELKVELDLAAGDVDGAATTVEACLARDFGKAGFHRLKAAVCRARGQHADAEDAMLWAAGLDPSCERASCEAAELLWTRGDARGARDVLSRLLSADPDSRRGRLLMARLAAEQGDLESVLREWNETERRRRLDDRESEAYVMALWASGELEEGDRRANRLRLEHPESAISWLLSARMARRQANLEASVEFYQAALEREASLVEARSGLSDCLEALERRPEAAEQAAEALKLAPENREFRWRLGRLLASTSKWAAAVEALEPMLEEAGAHHQEARMLLARVSLTMANRARAIDLLAFDEDPTAEMLELLGDLYYEAESWDRAADAYGRLAVLPRPMPFEREFRRAQACARAGRLADAASALEGLMPGAAGNARVTPALAKLAQELGRKLAAERRHGQAVRVLEAALVRLEVLDAEQRVELLMTVAELQETAGDWQAVDQALGRALELAPSSSRVLETVASHHASDRSFERLRDRMQAVLRREPGAALAHLYLGAALCRLGMANAGQDACARAARLSPGSAQCHLGFARAARQAGDLEGSVGGYRRVLELEPNHPAALLELADVYDVAGLTALLVDHCKMMERLEGVDRRLARKGRAILARVSGMPEQPRPQVQTVESAMLAAAGQGRWAEARAYAESLLRVDPHHLNALLTSAQVGLQSGDANTVSRMLRTAVAQHPGSSQAHFEMARFRACQGDPEGARIAAYRALGIAPASAEYAGFLAGLLLKDGQFEAAETVLRDALAASGSADETLRCELARLSERRGDLASAVRLLSEPPVETAGSLRELARLLAAAGDWKGAARLHADLLTAGASEQVAAAGEFAAKCLASGQRPLALALVRELTRAGSPPVALCHQLVGSTPAGEPEPALAHALEAALAHLPLSATTAERTSLTLAFVRQLELAGRPADAVERLESVLELDPSCGEAQARLAALLSASQSHERLRDRFERIVARAPDSFTAWLHLASARLVLGKALASQEAAVRALALDGNRFEARLALARACRLSGEHDRSIAEYRHALRLQPNHPRALYELAATYAAANLGELARGQWSKLLKVAPEGSELARSAWRRLSKARA
jgi:tetratricopeptide (TPR) repeat protein